MKEKIKLGQKVRDVISGIEGTATSRTEFLNGCVQYGITLKIKKGEHVTETTIQEINVDEQQLEIIKSTKKEIKKSNNGGPTRFKCFRR
jgi:hypothetical protein